MVQSINLLICKVRLLICLATDTNIWLACVLLTGSTLPSATILYQATTGISLKCFQSNY